MILVLSSDGNDSKFLESSQIESNQDLNRVISNIKVPQERE